MKNIIVTREPNFQPQNKYLKEDPYWQFLFIYNAYDEKNKIEGNENTYLCNKQRDFKKVCDYFAIEHKYDAISSPNKFPSHYPCKVQILQHFEGSMIYFMFKY